jgi:hypothetical protein
MIRNVPVLQVTLSGHMHGLIALWLRPFSRLSLCVELLDFLTTDYDGVVSAPRLRVRSQWSMLNVRCGHEDLPADIRNSRHSKLKRNRQRVADAAAPRGRVRIRRQEQAPVSDWPIRVSP